MNLLDNAGDPRDTGSIPGWGRSTGEGNGNPLQYSCLENFMDRAAWWATVHGVAESQTPLYAHQCTNTDLVPVVCLSRSVVSNSFVTPWTVACQAPLSTGFPRQEHWRGLPFPSPWLRDQTQVSCTGRFFATEPPRKTLEDAEQFIILELVGGGGQIESRLTS